MPGRGIENFSSPGTPLSRNNALCEEWKAPLALLAAPLVLTGFNPANAMAESPIIGVYAVGTAMSDRWLSVEEIGEWVRSGKASEESGDASSR